MSSLFTKWTSVHEETQETKKTGVNERWYRPVQRSQERQERAMLTVNPHFNAFKRQHGRQMA